MKRIVILCFCILLTLSGCVYLKPQESKSEQLSVVTTIFPLYDFVRAVGGNMVDIKLLISPGTEVHSFEPSPSDIMSIGNADCFFYIGGRSDEWVEEIINDNEKSAVALMDYVEPIEVRNEENTHEHFDEHIWTSPYNSKILVTKVAEVLSSLDSINSKEYLENAEVYCKQIDAVANDIKSIVNAAQNPFLLIADRNPYVYFARAFNLEYDAAFGGCANSSDISINIMKRLITTIKDKKLNCAFYTEMSNKNIAKAVAEQTGVRLYQLNSAHNVTLDEFKSGVTYVELMQQNAAALKEGFEVELD